MHTKILSATAAAVLLTAGTAAAQSTATTNDTTACPTAVAPVEEPDDDMDWGWLGLLGLVGLLGLRKRPVEHVRTHADTNTGTLNR